MHGSATHARPTMRPAALGWLSEALSPYAGASIPLAYLALVATEGWVWLPALFFFIGVPALDLVLGKDLGPRRKRPGLAEAAAPVVLVGLYVVTLAVGLSAVAAEADPATLLGHAIGVGTVGAIAFAAMHELVHRRGRGNRLVARAGLLGTAFLHFEIEHLCSHHRFAATPQDTSTARYGESVYRFLFRCIPHGMRFAWRFEAERLRRRGRSGLHPTNRMLWFSGLPVALTVALGIFVGPAAAALYAAQAVIASVTLMTTAYIEHYGLLRPGEAGHPASGASEGHSWDCYLRASNAFTLRVQRHADHHIKPTRPYDQLEVHAGTLELPTGYPLLILAAFVPPVWRHLMHPRLAAARAVAPPEA